MKSITNSIMFVLATVFTLMAAPAFADANYPYTNPVYIPNGDAAPATFSAPSTAYVLTTQNIGTVSLRVSGTCTSLAATVQGSNDQGTNYTALNLYPIATGITAPTAVASISAPGFWKINASGMNRVRLNISALTATCTVEMLGSPHAFNGVSF